MRIETAGFDAAINHLQRIQDELAGRSGSLYYDMGQTVYESTETNFAAAGRPTWPERQGDYDWPPLIKSGAMRNTALASTQDWQHSGGRHELPIRSTDYAAYHQFGTTRLPVRKFVVLQPSEIEDVKQRIARAVLGA